jgi:hypothetical protein
MTASRHLTEQIALVEAMQKLWTTLMPEAWVPTAQQFMTWGDLHTSDNLIYAIKRTANKFQTLNGSMTATYLEKYCSSVANTRKRRRIAAGQEVA